MTSSSVGSGLPGKCSYEILHEYLECVRLTKWYRFIFLRLSKVWNMFHHGSVSQVLKKNTTVCFHLLFWVVLLLLFFIIKFVFLSFLFLFWWSIKFPQLNINQSEAGFRGLKLSVELYAFQGEGTSRGK